MKTTLFFLLFTISLSAALAQSNSCILGNCNTGLGTYLWDSGNEYTGEWVEGVRTGLGAFDWENGTFYYGFFQDDKIEGKGFYIGLEEKDDLIGIFHEGVLSE